MLRVARLLVIASCALAVSPLAAAQAKAAAPAAKPAGAAVQSALTLSQDVYEIGSVVRGELVLANTTPEWVAIPEAAEIAARLRLIGEDGKEIAPTSPEQFGAAKTTQLGPGGFVGITFDARLLFPALQKEGRYTLAYRGSVGTPRDAPLRMIPAYDPARRYELELQTPDGPVVIELSPTDAPVSVHNIVNLARTGFFDGASVARAEPGVMVEIRGPATAAHRIVPFEKPSTPYLAGTVLLSAFGEDRERVSMPHLIVLLAPAPDSQGRYTVVGQVRSGLDFVAKFAAASTTGKSGSPPFRPQSPITIKTATIREPKPKP